MSRTNTNALAHELWQAWPAARGAIRAPAGLPATRAEADALNDAVRRHFDSAVFKLGATTHGSRRALGLDDPFFGAIPRARVLRSGDRLDPALCRQGLVELEIAFRLGSELDPATHGASQAGIAAAVDAALPAFELPESRFERIGEYGTLALIGDGGAAGWAVTGTPVALGEPHDYAASEAELRVNGARVARGSGAEVVPDPFGALLAHCRTRLERGERLPAGSIFLTGGLMPAHPMKPGEHIEGWIAGLGTVSLDFSA